MIGPDWELDSTILLELNDLLDDISVIQEELKSKDSDPGGEIAILAANKGRRKNPQKKADVSAIRLPSNYNL